jgi:hypothetical protein
MEKLVVVAAMISIQPEQTPFCIEDMWAWIARTINNVTLRPSKPPFFFAAILNSVLGITHNLLTKRYGDQFVSVVKIIKNDVVPILEESNDKERLKLFVEQFLATGGQTVHSFFSSS